jgi:thiosulfate/3-mercaptopyruvate sulfurtransferase
VRVAAVAFASALALAGAAAADDFAYVDDAQQAVQAGAVVLDVRPREACVERSLAGARCLPAADALGPHRRLASWRDVLWLLGTAGLAGNETVLVVGADTLHRDFVAGLLYAAGQARVLVLTQPVSRVLATGHASGPGHARAFARESVFEGPMRDTRIVLGHELVAMRAAATLLDGRSADEYWGRTVRGVRGGHVAGATSIPAAELRGRRRDDVALPDGSPVAYAHDAVEGFAYFTLLRAGLGLDARVYPGGWAEWSADAARPIDAATYPDAAAHAVVERPKAPSARFSAAAWIGVLAAGLAAAFATGLALGRRRSRGA